MDGKLTLEARDVSVARHHRLLIERVSLTILPSQLVYIMGSSGAGKTTLLTALNGHAQATSGAVFLNDIDLHANYDGLKAAIGYVPQDDIIHRELTVKEALYFSARLRLPWRFSGRFIKSRIAAVLRDLGIAGIERMPIGSPESKRGISGGERKRVNLAMELLTDPPFLFLDEPTSGLSSGDALIVMRLLRKLADSGKTIILTIHQPSLETLRLADKLVFVAKEGRGPGHVVYYGPAYPDAVNYFNPDGVPALANGFEPPPEAIEEGYRRGCELHGHIGWLRRYETPENSEAGSAAAASSPGKQEGTKPATVPMAPQAPPLAQWLTLTARGFAIKAKDRWQTLLLLSQAPIVGLLINAVFRARLSKAAVAENPLDASNAIAMAIFVLVLSALWFGCSNAVRDIVGEIAIHRRERMAGVSVGAYVASKFTVLGTLCTLQCVTLLWLVVAGCGLTGAWPEMLFAILLVALVGVAIGLFLSAFAKTSEASIAMLPIVLLPMVILGGALAPVHRLPAPVRALTQTMPSRWGFEAMLLIESESRMPFTRVRRDKESAAGLIAVAGDWAEDVFPQATCRFGRKTAYLALIATLAMFIVAIERALRAHDRTSCSSKLSSNRTVTDSKILREGRAAAPKAIRRPAIGVYPRWARMRGHLCATEITAITLMLVWLRALYEPMPAITAPQSKRSTTIAPSVTQKGRAADEKANGVRPDLASLAQEAPPSAEREHPRGSDNQQILTIGDKLSGDIQGGEAAASPVSEVVERAETSTTPAIGEVAERAEKQFRDHDYTGAISTFGWLISAAPTNARYYAMRARCYEETGDFQLAEEDAVRALNLATARHYDHGTLDAVANRLQEIRERIRRSKDLFEQGKRNFRYGDYSNALSSFTAVIALKQNSVASYHWRAVAYERLRRYAEALRDLDAAIQMQQADASLFYSRSFIHADLQEYAAAIDDVRTAERLAPGRMDYVDRRKMLVSELKRWKGQ